MYKNKIHRLPIQGLLLGCLLASACAQAEESQLVVKLTNIRDTTGHLRASLYSDPDSFRKEDKALRIISIPAAKGDAEMVFKNLKPGRYAIMAYHDGNNNEKLDLRFGMFPTEGYGLSNNPKVMGPPKFADSAFDVGGNATSVNIIISY